MPFDWPNPSVVPKSGMHTNQMNGLYPIIRRVRRPLVPVEGASGGADAKPTAPAALQPAEATKTQPQPEREKHGEATSNESAE
jgi:hypothetical protein